MINIPTELLRTLIAVVDMRSFTKAAKSLNITQPAVSAQIKRLQCLLNTELFDKSAPGVSLTTAGEPVVDYARRLLAINDQIAFFSNRGAGETIRIGIPADYVGGVLALALVRFRARWPNLRFHIRTDGLDAHLRDLRQGEIDIVVDLSTTRALASARHQWSEQLVWACGPDTRLAEDGPVPLVTYGEICLSHRTAVSVLSAAGREFGVAFRASSIASLAAAVYAGFGFMPLIESRVRPLGLMIADNTLPPLPEIFCGIYTRDGGERSVLEELADGIAAALGPRGDKTTIEHFRLAASPSRADVAAVSETR